MLTNKKSVYGGSAFGFAAPNDWNVRQKSLKLEAHVTISAFKTFFFFYHIL